MEPTIERVWEYTHFKFSINNAFKTKNVFTLKCYGNENDKY